MQLKTKSSDSATHVPSQQSVNLVIFSLSLSQIATKDNTDEITEGSTNLYFTLNNKCIIR